VSSCVHELQELGGRWLNPVSVCLGSLPVHDGVNSALFATNYLHAWVDGDKVL